MKGFFLEEKREKNMCDLVVGKNVRQASKFKNPQNKKNTNHKRKSLVEFDNIKIKSFCLLKGTLKKVKN